MFVENKLRKGHVLVPFHCVLASQGGFRYPRKKERKEMLPRIDQPCPLANFFSILPTPATPEIYSVLTPIRDPYLGRA